MPATLLDEGQNGWASEVAPWTHICRAGKGQCTPSEHVAHWEAGAGENLPLLLWGREGTGGRTIERGGCAERWGERARGIYYLILYYIIVLYYIILYYIILYYIILYYIILYYIILYCIILYYIILYYIILYYIILLYHIILYHILHYLTEYYSNINYILSDISWRSLIFASLGDVSWYSPASATISWH